ncbi:hypothetical protein DFS34DRAFT_102839 [Phlyctochytrium arcticum]|nr:hypothetical protein DFS34DRAFT_102839 [Phlyctochytrium arcticum]
MGSASPAPSNSREPPPLETSESQSSSPNRLKRDRTSSLEHQSNSLTSTPFNVDDHDLSLAERTASEDEDEPLIKRRKVEEPGGKAVTPLMINLMDKSAGPLSGSVNGHSNGVGVANGSNPPSATSQAAPEKYTEVRSAKYKRILDEERSGYISFRLAHNDGTKDNLIYLSKLKTVIQAQLPKMPREYISRVVYSREHFSYVVVRGQNEVIGGITFRPFENRKFAEIVFLAVLSGNQTSGYGARLMAHFKDYVRDTFGVQHLLTYADNFAIGFFKKQGFTSEISLEKAIWVGYIKDYEGATLLQCTFFPKVRYLDIYSIYAAHRKAVFEKMRQYSNSHIVYEGLEDFKNGAKSVDPADIPGLREAGWTSDLEERIRSTDETRSPMYYMLSQLIGELRENQNAWPFTEPVSGVPDYYEIIKQPMDLRTLGEHLEEGKYNTVQEFENEFHLIVHNCKIYNDDHTQYVKW